MRVKFTASNDGTYIEIMPALLFKSDSDPDRPWAEALTALMPELEVRIWPELGDVDDIEYALIWKAPGDVLARLPNLRAIFSIGAGVDHLIGEPDLPAGIRIIRMVDPSLTVGMSEYVIFHVLRHHRRMPEYEEQQRHQRWCMFPQRAPAECRVGIMGLGVLGRDAADKLAALDFAVAGWSRSPKTIDGVESFHGEAQLKDFLARTDILVCLLPLTPSTVGILNRANFAALPKGAYVINAARGDHLIEVDLLEALDSGSIAGATLDAFHTEPLPPEHPFWRHPRVTVTPHVASMTNPYTAAVQIVDNIRRLKQNQTPTNIVDLNRGY